MYDPNTLRTLGFIAAGDKFIVSCRDSSKPLSWTVIRLSDKLIGHVQPDMTTIDNLLAGQYQDIPVCPDPPLASPTA